MGKKGYYKLFGIYKESTSDEIKSAYRKKAKDIHPDKNQDIDTTKEFQQLNEAYEVLSNPELKKDYDREEISFEYDTNIKVYTSDYGPDVNIYINMTQI